jgi:glutathione synthase/RimK-type ligase-like ATP-grasp enzyme
MPLGTSDDVLLGQALTGSGVDVRYAAWDDPQIDWSIGDLTVVRSTWNYHLQPLRWATWLDTVDARTVLVNSAALIRWNGDKSYLLALAEAGVPIIPTVLIDTRDDLASACAERRWDDIVVKPTIGASSFGTIRFSGAEIARDAQNHVDWLLNHGAVILQPYQTAVEKERERSLVYIDGVFSHAFSKPDFHAGLEDEGLLRHEPGYDEFALAEQLLTKLPERASIARIDMLPCEDGLCLMEAELIEPQLAFHLSDGSASVLADTLVRMAHKSDRSNLLSVRSEGIGS